VGGQPRNNRTGERMAEKTVEDSKPADALRRQLRLSKVRHCGKNGRADCESGKESTSAKRTAYVYTKVVVSFGNETKSSTNSLV